MKITVSKTIAYDVRQYVKYQEEIEIDPKLLEQIEEGEHEEYDSIEDWAQAQDIDFCDIGECWDGHSEETGEEEYEVEYEEAAE